MKAKLTFLCLLFVSIKVFSQEIPVINVGNKKISIKKLKVKVSIIGDIAITTYDMQFYNPKNRVLEGELSFPLGENQSVTQFALDINGTLREAVVVEKEKARVAFESTVRNKIDPALLEQTKGNNYKARVYPIPAKGYKRVVLTFQQKLIINNESFYYKLPFNFKYKLEDFSLSIEVLNQKNKPKSKSEIIKEFKYNAEEETYYSTFKKNKVRVAKPVIIKIPLNKNKEKLITNKNYFYFNKQLNFETKRIDLEKDITIFWDASLSQKNKKLDSEISFLNSYFKQVENCKVNFVLFNIDIKSETQFLIKKGNWNQLKNEIKNVVYDGGSSFSFFNGFKNDSNLNLLFTDGLNTLSDSDLKLNNKTHIINSSSSANHLFIKNAAIRSGGKYINLQQESINNAIEKISKSQLQFLGTNFTNEELEVYPKEGSVINNNFSIYGRGGFLNKKVKLYFGFGKDTVKTTSFYIKQQESNNKTIAKLWAQNKLNFLTSDLTKNRDKVIKLSKKYQIISPFTSMIILDRVEDYVTHKIEPPKELKKEYDNLLAERVNNKKERLEDLKEELFDDYEEFFSWFDKDYVLVEKKLNDEKIIDSVKVVETRNHIVETHLDTISRREGSFTLSGVVSDENGPLPGVIVLVKGTTVNTETDFDGNYSIRAKTDDKLVFSYVGMKTVEKPVGATRSINIDLESDENLLYEVVVVGYGTRTTRRSMTASVTTIKSESIVNVLEGNVSGVQINEDSNINIRGINSVSNSKPLYVVNGKIIDDYKDLNPNEIQSIYTLKSEDGNAIYGSRANNGIVVIVTKKGFEDDLEEIEEFEYLVKQKIEFKGWNPETPYLKVLNKISNNDLAYDKYIELREKYNKSPSFYIDVADFFKNRKQQKRAIQILTNVAEIDLNNYELLKAIAYKFEEYKMYNYAIYIYKEILDLRPEDIQSYRDLALVFENNREYQKSLDLLYKIVNGELLEKDEDRRFSGIEVIALNELNRILTLYKKDLTFSHIDKKYIKSTQADLRVLIDWNHNDTDIDLWVTDPNNEKCFYKHKKTKIGGLMSEDMTEGFGPEQFVLKNAIKGNYKINVKYYASEQQKISGPTFLKITTFKNYGHKNEVKKIKLVRLTEVDDVLDIGELVF